ncbi:MAG: hypothetical protein V7L22_33775 [Nostoc sp.]
MMSRYILTIPNSVPIGLLGVKQSTAANQKVIFADMTADTNDVAAAKISKYE